MPSVSKRLKAVGTAAAAAALCAGAIAAAAPSQASSPRSAIPGTHPEWASASARVSAQPVTTGTVNARVYLAGQDAAGLAAYAAAVSQPGNAAYGRYLSPAQVNARFGPTSAQIDAVKAWLTSEGLTVTSVNDSVDGYVAVSGNVSNAAKAFSVTFQNFRGPDKRTDRAPAQSASAPASVAGAVLGVTGLDTAKHQMKPGDTLPPPDPNYWVAGPCSQYYAQKIATTEPTAYGKHQPWNVCGYTPSQVRGAYGVSTSGMTGKGQTVAIVDAYASPTMPSPTRTSSPPSPGTSRSAPASTSSTCRAPSPTPRPTSATRPAGTASRPSTWSRCTARPRTPTSASSRAPAATTPDLLNALAYIVDNHLASIVSNSWGEPSQYETMASEFDQVFKVGAIEGIGFFFSSGDSGYESPGEDVASRQPPDRLPAVQPVGDLGGRHRAWPSARPGTTSSRRPGARCRSRSRPTARPGRTRRPACTRRITTAPAAAA